MPPPRLLLQHVYWSKCAAHLSVQGSLLPALNWVPTWVGWLAGRRLHRPRAMPTSPQPRTSSSPGD